MHPRCRCDSKQANSWGEIFAMLGCVIPKMTVVSQPKGPPPSPLCLRAHKHHNQLCSNPVGTAWGRECRAELEEIDPEEVVEQKKAATLSSGCWLGGTSRLALRDTPFPEETPTIAPSQTGMENLRPSDEASWEMSFFKAWRTTSAHLTWPWPPRKVRI